MITVYKITNPDGQVYVGRTKNLRVRKAAHKWASKQANKKLDTLLCDSIRKYGWEAHKFEIIEVVQNEKADEREIFWIKELGTYFHINPKGLNMTLGGIGYNGSWMYDVERRIEQSKKYTGTGNPFFGKTHGEEWRKQKSKEVLEYNKRNGITVPASGAEKGRLKIVRSVLCYDKYGNFLIEYDSLTDAAQKLSVNIHSIIESCQGVITGVLGKYVFRYKTPNYPLKIDVGEIKTKTAKRPVLYLNKNHEIIKEYASSLEASIDLKTPKTTINRAACYNQLRPIRTGHIFIYKDIFEQKLKEAL